MKQFFIFFFMQFLYYGLLTWNYRAIANIWPGSVVTTDLLVAAVQFKVIKRITGSADHGFAFWGYVSGGAVGSLISMYASVWMFGK